MIDERNPFTKIFTAACTGMLLFGIVIISLGSLLPTLMDAYGISEIEAGTLASILPLGILVGSFVFGPLVDRYSYKLLLTGCTAIIIGGFLLLSFAHQLFHFQLGFFIIGTGGGAINGGTNALVSDISENNPASKSANLSLLGVFFGLGALGIPALMAFLTDVIEIKEILIYLSIVLTVPLLFFSTIRFPPAKQTQGIPVEKFVHFLQDRTIILLGFFLFFQSGMEGILNNWTTTYLEDIRELRSDQALFMLTLLVVGLTVARIFLAGLLRIFSSAAVLFGCLTLCLAGIIFLVLGSSIWTMGLAYALMGAGLAAGFPVILGYVGNIYPAVSGTAFSFVFVIAIFGNMVLNFSMGLLSSHFGFEVYPVMVITALIFLILLLIVSLREVSNKLTL